LGVRPKCWRLMSAAWRVRASPISSTPVATRAPALAPAPCTSCPSRSTKVPLPRARSPGSRGSVCAAQRERVRALGHAEAPRGLPATRTPYLLARATHHAQECDAAPEALELLGGCALVCLPRVCAHARARLRHRRLALRGRQAPHQRQQLEALCERRRADAVLAAARARLARLGSCAALGRSAALLCHVRGVTLARPPPRLEDSAA